MRARVDKGEGMDVQDIDMGKATVCVRVRVNTLEVRGGEGKDMLAWTHKRVGEEGRGRKNNAGKVNENGQV